ncbi:MAG: glycosyltransferase [Pirellulaceae bacterium]
MNTLKRPLNVMFVITSMPVGGAETLLVNLVRSFDRRRISPQICCLKDLGVLGEQLQGEIPVHSHLIHSKFDVNVVFRLRKLFRDQQIDAVVTVGAGDKMFWGRIGARFAGVPVILSALHSTGWPDGVGCLNRFLTPLTDGFIGVARSHGQFLADQEKFPRSKVFVIRNGIDTDRFMFSDAKRSEWRSKLDISADAPTVGIVAALRAEKNHKLFLQAAQFVSQRLPKATFVIAGDGEIRGELESYAAELGIEQQVRFAGNVSDTPGLLSAIDLFALTSDNEASPVSIVEAMACQRPVVSTDVGSVNELVSENETGYLTPTGDFKAAGMRWLDILESPTTQRSFGKAARSKAVSQSSLTGMVDGYTRLIENLYSRKTGIRIAPPQPLTIVLPTTETPTYNSTRFR